MRKYKSIFQLLNSNGFSTLTKKINPDPKRKLLKSHTSFVDSSEIIKKFEVKGHASRPRSMQAKIENPINSIDFDDFTQRLSRNQITINQNSLPNDENAKNFIPWSSNTFSEPPQEKNILAPLDLYHLIKEEDAQDLFQRFIKCLSEQNLEDLFLITENSFCSTLKKNLLLLRDNKFTLSFENIDKSNVIIDLYDIRNIFGVGVHLNRKRNSKAKNYIISQSIFNNIPIKQIIPKRLNGKEKGAMILQFHLAITTKTTLTMLNHQNRRIYEENKEKPIIHSMVLESEVFECEYKGLKNILRHSNKGKNEVGEMNFSDLKIKEKEGNLKIIDFDNFMNGNELIKSEFF